MLADEVKSDLDNVIDERLNLMNDSDTEFTSQKMKFSKEDFSVNVTESAVSCRFGHIY